MHPLQAPILLESEEFSGLPILRVPPPLQCWNMKQSVKLYADTLFDGTRAQSAAVMRRSREAFQQQRAVSARATSLLSGSEVRGVVSLLSEHIRRCISGRLESYARAYREDDSFPFEQDFAEILNECHGVRAQEIHHAVDALREFIVANGKGIEGSFIPNASTFEAESAESMESVTHDWKGWKARAQLKSERKVELPQKQLDLLMPIYNRAELDKDIQDQSVNAKANGSPLSFLFMDLDKFKQINDGPGGHDAGDQALRLFGTAVQGVCAGKGTAYRLGGDEVCVLLPNHSIDEACAVAERIRGAVSRVQIDGTQRTLSTSIGVSNFPETTSDPSQLRSQADEAMYVSKKAGGNRFSKSS